MNPAVRGFEPVTFFDKMFVRVDKGRGEDFGEDGFAYVAFSFHLFAGDTGELLAVSSVSEKRHRPNRADTFQRCPAGNTVFLFQFSCLLIIRACGLVLFFDLPRF